MPFDTLDTIAVHGGTLHKLSHESTATKTPMAVNVYVPPAATKSTISSQYPVLLYLSGLTCTPQNASEKSFLTYFAAKYHFAIVFPDTSPRGANIAGEEESWDFGTGAGFYVDATEKPWSENYQMYTYVMDELLPLIQTEFSSLDMANCAITGHSMGGYGALMMYMKNPGRFTSVSAFAPIVNPSIVPWGEKCFGNYLGTDDKTKWEQYDPCHLIKDYNGDTKEILIHVGDKDPFYYRDHQLRCENLVDAAKGTPMEGKVHLKVVPGYDHSYYFISSFAEAHVEHHLKYWKRE